MKLLKLFVFTILVSGLFLFNQSCKSVSSTSKVKDSKEALTISDPDIINTRVIKILAIGNSFSQDAIETYLYELAQAENIKVIIGNLYIGGASLDLHWANAKDDKAAYEYRKIDQYGNKTNTPKTSIASALEDENWDFISFQQVSSSSGIYDSYVTPLPLLYDYVSARATNKDVKYILHQTWAYSKDSNHKLYGNYNHDQMKMYKSIIDATSRVKNLVPIDIVVPAGTAIQNGRTSVVGDNFCKDGYHLEVNIGRYTAACTWFEALFNKNVIGNTYKPETITDFEADLAQHAAHYAITNPNKITKLKKFKKRPILSQLIDLDINYNTENSLYA